MITLKNIMKAVNVKLRENFQNIPIQSTDIREGFQRPCFYVEFDEVNTLPLNTYNVHRKIPVKIYFFPTDPNKYRLEILDVQDILEQKFLGNFKVTDNFNTMIEEINCQISDGVLECTFEIEYIQLKSDLISDIQKPTFDFTLPEDVYNPDKGWVEDKVNGVFKHPETGTVYNPTTEQLYNEETGEHYIGNLVYGKQ